MKKIVKIEGVDFYLDHNGRKIRIRKQRLKTCIINMGWENAGRRGKIIGNNIYTKQLWTPVLWDGEEDPDFHKTQGLTIL